MSKLNEDVKKLLEESKTWVVATCADKPNAIAVFFKAVEGDELVVFDVFMNKTLQNLESNKNVAITVYNEATLQGYQLKGTATYSTDADLLGKGNAAAEGFGLKVKGALLVDIQETYVLTPGPNVGKKL